jgi:hypothetical protein
MDYKQKYLKYKSKYLALQKGAAQNANNQQVNIDDVINTQIMNIITWNGEGEIQNVIQPFNHQDHPYLEVDEQLNIAQRGQLRRHPLVRMMIDAGYGFRWQTILDFFNMTRDECINLNIHITATLDAIKAQQNVAIRNLTPNEFLAGLNLEFLQGNIAQIIVNLVRTQGNANGGNPLQGTKRQVYIWLFFLNSPFFQQFRHGLTHGTQQERMTMYVRFNTIFDVDALGANDDEHDDDLDERAHYLVDKITRMQNDFVCLIDGHGRVIKRIFELMLEQQDPNDQNRNLFDFTNMYFMVADINMSNTIYHLLTCIENDHNIGFNDIENGNIDIGNIVAQIPNSNFLGTSMAVQMNMLDHLIHHFSIRVNGIIYLNFSGLDDMGPATLQVVQLYNQSQNLAQAQGLENHDTHRIIVSFAFTNIFNVPQAGPIDLVNGLNALNFVPITNRFAFRTMAIAELAEPAEPEDANNQNP